MNFTSPTVDRFYTSGRIAFIMIPNRTDVHMNHTPEHYVQHTHSANVCNRLNAQHLQFQALFFQIHIFDHNEKTCRWKSKTLTSRFTTDSRLPALDLGGHLLISKCKHPGLRFLIQQCISEISSHGLEVKKLNRQMRVCFLTLHNTSIKLISSHVRVGFIQMIEASTHLARFYFPCTLHKSLQTHSVAVERWLYTPYSQLWCNYSESILTSS